MNKVPEASPAAMIKRLRKAVNEHNLEALVACFAPDYRNDAPVHPSRAFSGLDQVRGNWEQIFKFVPDISAEVLRYTVDGDVVWSEWEHRGTRPDGSAHLMRGVVIFGVTEGVASWARFYLEPVQDDGADVGAAVRQQVVTGEGS